MPDLIKTFDFKPGLAAEIELVPISAILHQHQPIISQPHRADFYHICWFTKGTPVHTVDFTPLPIQPNTLLFINKNRVHFFDQTGNYDGWLLLFTDAFFVHQAEDAQFLHQTILFNDLLDVPTLRLDESTTNLTLVLNQLQDELAGPDDEVHESVLKNLLHNLLMLADRVRRT